MTKINGQTLIKADWNALEGGGCPAQWAVGPACDDFLRARGLVSEGHGSAFRWHGNTERARALQRKKGSAK